jgi:hypothetical protein
LGRHVSSARINQALRQLAATGRIRGERRQTGGRPEESWWLNPEWKPIKPGADLLPLAYTIIGEYCRQIGCEESEICEKSDAAGGAIASEDGEDKPSQ